jgi:chemotaxis protein methyltransferase CheR
VQFAPESLNLHSPFDHIQPKSDDTRCITTVVTGNHYMTETLPIDYENLRALIQVRTGLLLTDHRIDEMRRIADVVQVEADTAGIPDLTRLLETLPPTHALWQRFIQGLTIGETYFFRNQAHFQALRNQVLPDLILARRNANLKQLRLWSAGCATGEEPYSLAILLRELLPDFESWAITIMGTDINKSYLEYARQGIYQKRSFRNETPDSIKQRWFTAEAEGYQLDPTVRDMVLFRQLNLIEDFYPSSETYTTGLDLIMCRNVTIYFDEETTNAIIVRFHQALNQDGWLVVGHSEPQVSKYRIFAARNFENTVLYQKSANAIPAVDSSKAPTQPSAPTRKRPLPSKTPKPVSKPRPRTAPRRVPEIAPTPAPPKATAEVMDADTEGLWQQAHQAADHEEWGWALDLLQRLERANKMQPQVHYLRALIEIQTGHQEKAVASLRQSIYCDPEFVLAHYILGELHEKQGANIEALRCWREARKITAGLDPESDLPFAEDLTAEMLHSLLDFRINQLSDRIQGR